jgi:alkanesulfonate monooxygenase SsuD/methylene tetrahydromethanopterin reductase-like flavin-dependent oxidoreductase (luciferase family)
MIWSDCYATLALAAHHTSTIKLGTGVAIVGTRLAPVTAHSIASINRIAPGRAFLGIGTGHTAMRVMGFDPVKPREFREYLRVVRGLLSGEEVEYTLHGETRPIQFMHQSLGFVNVADQVPIYVAANGPLALKTAGAYGDGRISAGGEPNGVFISNLNQVKAGAEAIGRTLDDGFHTAALTFACVLEPGEPLTSDRVIDEVGSMVSASLHFWYELYLQQGSDAFIRPEIRDVWDQYLARVETMDPARRHMTVHDGHCTYLMPEERKFITPEMIRASGGLVGEPDEIIAMLKDQESAGLKEVTLLPPMAVARKNYADFARHVIERY